MSRRLLFGTPLRDWTRTVIGCVIVAIILFPLYWMTNVSLQPRAALLATELRFLPIPPLTENYVRVFGEQAGSIGTSLFIATTTAIVCLLIAAPAAYALVVFRLRWLTLFVLLLLIVQMIPHVVVANALYAIYARAGLLNTHLGLILADASMGVPFAILILRAFIVSLPRSLIEAALVDGATHWGAFTRIILPLSRNGLITSGLFCFLFAWSDFLFALTMGTQGKIVPITLGIYKYIGNENTSWNSIMAAAVLASIPPIVLLLAGQRYITAGLVGGAVKE
ncbi:MAG: carbohydrate ABC transporter permease [Devosia sp.]|uniref:carbohydrate ABC transporter permease n=1 Tax=Devosia sp. 66-22 TaxID=1895753 RepID=UPI00092927C7|nr:carbohydrate ABC transporter permease [Devosia sp. 66-22]MBN9348246.1 carbohydrate ABC transporter permease [Devosia sp.]OJX47504.1 MAG: ABC transporter permease [Devosia sp. 66-22]